MDSTGLRDHLLAAQAAAGQAAAAAASVDMHSTPSHESLGNPGVGSSAVARAVMDPAMGPPGFGGSPITPGMEPQNPEVRKGRRELSTSKRAAQNRAAQVCPTGTLSPSASKANSLLQRAFRQRKEQYIQSLKAQVSEYEAIASHYKVLEDQNLLLREYSLELKRRLLAHGDSDIPPLPFDLSRPTAGMAAAAAAVAAINRNAEAAAAQEEAMSVEAQLQAAAAAADDGDSDEDGAELSRQLHAAAEAAMESARSIRRGGGDRGEGPSGRGKDVDDDDDEVG
jgi:hypothetical protein